ncbi:MAG: DUF924 domain-containing protein [Gammaproteobacteria bacterium]|nr:DUF924 domain-containing protein [Gammaproteobacteria bacterium]
MNPDDILTFWFADDMRRAWFRSTPELDALIRDRFEATWLAAAEGALEHWQATPYGALALAIVLDQLPLNMFRGQARAFATEAAAIAVSKQAIAAGFDAQLAGDRVAFLYMPLMHSESLRDQDLSVKLFEAAGLKDNLRFARHHRELIRRFGHFPHRNEILGRTSTVIERLYLASNEAFTG